MLLPNVNNENNPKKCKFCGKKEVIGHGKNRRKCKSCGKTWSTEQKKSRKHRVAAEQWVKDRSTYARIKEKTGVSKMGKWKQVQAYGEGIPFPIEYSFEHFQKASGILLLDATFTKVGGEERAVHIAYDLAIGVVDFWIDDTENKTAYWYMLRRLKERGYHVRCIIGDGHWGIIHLVRELHVPFQWCHYHLLRELKRKLKKGLGALEGEAAIIFRRCRWILAARSMEVASERVRVFGKEYPLHFPKKHSVITWFVKHLDHATTFLSFPGETIPSGTYLLENFNGQIKQRLKTTRGMKSDLALENLLKILCFFTFCK